MKESVKITVIAAGFREVGRQEDAHAAVVSAEDVEGRSAKRNVAPQQTNVVQQVARNVTDVRAGNAGGRSRCADVPSAAGAEGLARHSWSDAGPASLQLLGRLRARQRPYASLGCFVSHASGIDFRSAWRYSNAARDLRRLMEDDALREPRRRMLRAAGGARRRDHARISGGKRGGRSGEELRDRAQGNRPIAAGIPRCGDSNSSASTTRIRTARTSLPRATSSWRITRRQFTSSFRRARTPRSPCARFRFATAARPNSRSRSSSRELSGRRR